MTCETVVRFGPRRPSFKKRLAARTSWKRYVRHNLGLKAPRGYGWLTNPKKAAYNRVYSRTTFDVLKPGRARTRRGKRASIGPTLVMLGILILAALLFA